MARSRSRSGSISPAQLRELEHGADRAATLVEHGEHEGVEVGIAVAGGEQRGHEVGHPARLLLVLPAVEDRRAGRRRRSPVSGVGSSTKHDEAAATTMACFVPKCR